MELDNLQKIIDECIAGKRHAQETMYKMFSSKMYAVCLRYAKNEAEAQDILQDGFIKVFKNINKFKNKGSFEGWMRRMMINISLERIRRERRMHVVDNLNSYTTQTESNSAIEELSAQELIQIIQSLPSQYKAVFNMYVIDNMNHKEIGKALNISENTSKSNLHRARNILKEKIEQLKDREQKILNLRY